jgi:hypothetical protein
LDCYDWVQWRILYKPFLYQPKWRPLKADPFHEVSLTSLINILYIFLIGVVGVESNWVHSALRPPIGLLCQPRVIMLMEKLVE